MQNHPPLPGRLIPNDRRIAESLVMVTHLVDRAVDRLAPIDRPVGIKRALRLLGPRDQIAARGHHHLLVTRRITQILARVKKMKLPVLAHDTPGPCRLGLGAGQVAMVDLDGHRQLGPVHQVTADNVGPLVVPQVEDMILALVIERDGVARRSSHWPEVEGRLEVGGGRLDGEVVTGPAQMQPSVPDCGLPSELTVGKPAGAVGQASILECPHGQRRG